MRAVACAILQRVGHEDLADDTADSVGRRAEADL